MLSIFPRNVHDALPAFAALAKRCAVERDSRNGKVRVLPLPLTTIYERPAERVLFWDSRDANPFFHFFESLWMLAGRNDVAFPAGFAKSIAQFSDDGSTFHGAYGERWRKWFADRASNGPIDQLARIAAALRANKDDRRQVLSMWDAEADLGLNGKDLPCNTHAYVQVSADGYLDLMVCNRSNDAVWGAYGANAVHFSMLQEYLAGHIGVPTGRYFQTSMNTHFYERHFALVDRFALLASKLKSDDVSANPYRAGVVKPFPIFDGATVEDWDADLSAFFQGRTPSRTSFFKEVVMPLRRAHDRYCGPKEKPKNERIDGALEQLARCAATDWALAAKEWLERRRE